MTEAQLKKLDDAVTLQRDIGTCNERLEALKADLIREARSHKEDFTIIEGGGSPALHFGKLVAFPRFIHGAVLGIMVKWIALILAGVYTFQLLAYHAWTDLGVVWTSIGAAFLFNELRGAGPELAWWTDFKTRFGPKSKFQVVQKARPRGAAESNDVYASIDPILDKSRNSACDTLLSKIVQFRKLEAASDRKLPGPDVIL